MTVHAERSAANHALRGRVAERAAVHPVRVGPWTRPQCRALALVHAAVLGVIVLSYWKTGGEAYPADQLRWLSLSVVALLVAAAADCLFFARGHRLTSRVRRHLFAPAPVTAGGASETFLAVPGTRRFHTEGCALAAGKSVTAAGRAQHVGAGLIPCEVCAPGGEG